MNRQPKSDKSKSPDDLVNPLGDGLGSEIKLLREAIRQMMRLSQQLGDPEKTIRALSTVGLTATRLASLLKAQLELQQAGAVAKSAAFAALNTALSELAQEIQEAYDQ
jgi:hypothetical protein